MRFCFADVDHRRGANPERRIQAFLISRSARDDGSYPFRNQQFEAKQPHGSGPRNQGRISDAHIGDFGDCLHHGREGFAHGGFIQRKIFRNAVELVRTHDHVAGKCAIHPVPHAPAIGAKDEVSRAAVLALATGNGGGAQACDSFSQRGVVVDVPAHLHHRAGKLMPQNDRGIVAKRIVKNMEIRSADSTIGDLQLYLVVSATRFLNFPYIDVPFATRVLDQSFHVGGSLTATSEMRAT